MLVVLLQVEQLISREGGLVQVFDKLARLFSDLPAAAVNTAGQRSEGATQFQALQVCAFTRRP